MIHMIDVIYKKHLALKKTNAIFVFLRGETSDASSASAPALDLSPGQGKNGKRKKSKQHFWFRNVCSKNLFVSAPFCFVQKTSTARFFNDCSETCGHKN